MWTIIIGIASNSRTEADLLKEALAVATEQRAGDKVAHLKADTEAKERTLKKCNAELIVPRHALIKGVQSRKEPFGGLDPNGSRQVKVVRPRLAVHGARLGTQVELGMIGAARA